jgi:ABC-type bacteriocin/lantibiotic exporter with double-glycine peptidase domain
MFRLLKRMGVLFEKKDRLSFFFLSLAILFNSFLEVLGISLIVPFISLLAHPEMLETNVYLHRVYHSFPFHSFLQFMVVLDIFIIGFFIIKNVILFLMAFLQAKFLLDKQTYISTRLFKAYLLSPYSFHLQRNLGQFQEKLRAVEGLMQRGVLSILIILTEGLLVTCLFLLLLRTNPLLTIFAMAVLAGGIFLYFYFLKDKLHRWGEITNRHIMLLEQQINQGLGSIKESKLLGKEFFFINSYSHHSHQMADHQNKSELVIRSPRLFIETMVVVLVMLSMLFCRSGPRHCFRDDIRLCPCDLEADAEPQQDKQLMGRVKILYAVF